MPAHDVANHIHGTGPAEAEPGRRSLGLAALGGVLGALAASSCCLLPLALFGVGVSGAWIANLTALAPYQLLTFTVAVLAFGFYRVSARRNTATVQFDDEKTSVDSLVKATTEAGFPSQLQQGKGS